METKILKFDCRGGEKVFRYGDMLLTSVFKEHDFAQLLPFLSSSRKDC